MIKFDYSYALDKKEFEPYKEQVKKIDKALREKTCLGSDYVGWVDWAFNYDLEEFSEVKKAATRIRENADVFIVCGIGGSYLGARSAIEMINGLYADKKPEIIYCGNSLSSNYLSQILKHIENKSVYLNVISKSGTTTETAVAFRILEQFIVNKYGKEEAKKRIIATTDSNKGTLRELAIQKGYQRFVVPNNIGGRYSVITSVGLLPIAVAGIDIDEVMRGVKDATNDFNNDDLETNACYQYAVSRRILNASGKVSEMLVSYEMQLSMLAEWWKQLYGESEGKEGKGLLPTSCVFSTDLHSMGQFIQEGNKVLFETILNIENPIQDITFPTDEDNLDNMNYLAGKNLDWVNKMAQEGTLKAHHDTGNVSNLIISLKEINAYSYGYLVYFFFLACGMSVLLLDVNPFNQPGVEVYKKNMFKLLGKE